MVPVPQGGGDFLRSGAGLEGDFPGAASSSLLDDDQSIAILAHRDPRRHHSAAPTAAAPATPKTTISITVAPTAPAAATATKSAVSPAAAASPSAAAETGHLTLVLVQGPVAREVRGLLGAGISPRPDQYQNRSEQWNNLSHVVTYRIYLRLPSVPVVVSVAVTDSLRERVPFVSFRGVSTGLTGSGGRCY